jgi:diguanylate cyclase (GGDEF)-like protein/PAS domain S-box-containing protein
VGWQRAGGKELELSSFEAVVRNLPDPLVALDANANVIWANDAAERLIGEPVANWVGRSAIDLVHHDDMQLAAVSLLSVQDKDLGSLIELRVKSADGWRLVELAGSNRLEDPEVGAILLSMRDITQRRRWEVATDQTARFRTLVHHVASLIMLVSPEGTVQSASGAITRLLGLDQERVEGRPFAAIVDPADIGDLTSALARAVDAPPWQIAPTTVEVGLLRSDGESVPFELSLVNLLDDPTVRGLVVSGHDVSQLRASRLALQELANRDPLTGLLNRAAFERAVDLIRLEDDGQLAFAFLDLNGFKKVNDRCGHEVGDEVLRVVSQRLRLAVRDDDLVARWGGDEFVVTAQIDSATEAQGMANRLRDVMAQPLEARGIRHNVTASVGHAIWQPGDTVRSVIDRADRSMYEAKSVVDKPAPRTATKGTTSRTSRRAADRAADPTAGPPPKPRSKPTAKQPRSKP